MSRGFWGCTAATTFTISVDPRTVTSPMFWPLDMDYDGDVYRPKLTNKELHRKAEWRVPIEQHQRGVKPPSDVDLFAAITARGGRTRGT